MQVWMPTPQEQIISCSLQRIRDGRILINRAVNYSYECVNEIDVDKQAHKLHGGLQNTNQGESKADIAIGPEARNPLASSEKPRQMPDRGMCKTIGTAIFPRIFDAPLMSSRRRED